MSHSHQFSVTSTADRLEGFDVYRIARRAAAGIHKLCGALSRGNAELASQARRASTAVVLNIAEGIGRAGAGAKHRSFSIARGECVEAAAALDLMQAIGILTGACAAPRLRDLDRVRAMLNALIRRWRE